MKKMLPALFRNRNEAFLTLTRSALAVSLFFLVKTGTAQVSVVLQPQPPLCGGFSTGVIAAFASGGSSPYSYLWSTGSINNVITNLPEGTYTVTVTDALGATVSASATLTAPPPLQAEITVTNCSLPGAMTVEADGGVEPYAYLWDNGANSQSISNLGAGEYCVTVMDNNNCGFSICEFIGTQLTTQIMTTPVICGSNTGGTATAQPSGGITPYAFNWSNGQTGNPLNNLAAGAYSVTVTAANGCSVSANANVGATPGNFSITFDITHPICPGTATGNITSTVMGAVQPLAYLWNSGQTTPNISNLSAGTYILTVTDDLSCTDMQSAVLSYQNNLNVAVTSVNPTCAGALNGSATATASNGTGPYTYAWSNGGSTQTINNITNGTYTVTVADATGCTGTASAVLTAPSAFSVNVTTTNVSQCAGSNGSATAVLSPGVPPPVSYAWSNGGVGNTQSGLTAGVYTVTVTSGNGCTASDSGIVAQPNNLDVTITGSSLVCGNAGNGTLTALTNYGTLPYSYQWSNGANTVSINNLPAGTYSVTVTSSEGCTGSATKTIAGSPQINMTYNIQNVKCFGTPTGSIQVNATGGTPPLNYAWSNGSTQSGLTNIPSGSYSVTVTDNVGCTKTENFFITQPSALNITFNSSVGSCGNDGMVMANVAGGTTPFQYSWNTGATTPTIFFQPPGMYSVTVADANGCSASANTQLIAFPAVTVDVTATNTTCNGTTDGTATATPSGGTPPFQFNWNNAETTGTITGLTPGNYIVTVTDENGCKDTGDVVVLLGDGLNVSVDAPAFVCPGEPQSATANAMGGTGDYTYEWGNGQTTQTATGLNSGSYTVTVYDDMGCFGSASTTLLPGGTFTTTSSFENVSCNGFNDASITLNVTDGILPYAFQWSNGDTTHISDSLVAGAYEVTVSDSTGCSQTFNFDISEPSLLELAANSTNGTCGGFGTATASASGGTPSYNYEWSTGSTSSGVIDLTGGTYYVTVTDAQACTAVDSVFVEEEPAPVCFVEMVQPVSTITGSDGQLTVVIDGGEQPFSFTWSNGQTTQTATGLAPGTHNVTVTDANNCQTNCFFTLLKPGKVGDLVWLDEDEDGLQDQGEGGIGDVTVTLTGTDGYGRDVDETTTTSAAGSYSFDVQPGDYKINFSPPSGYGPSPQNQGNDDTADSDANIFTGTTATFTIVENEENLTIDAGFHPAPPCENVTVAGAICCDRTLCGPGIVPAAFTQTTAPTGGSGDLEFLWMYATSSGPFDPDTWIAIDSANGADFEPGPFYETTYLVRTVRRENCIEFLPSNIVTISVDSIAVAEINGPAGVCVNTPVDFTATDNGPGAAYVWNFSGGSPDSAGTPAVSGVVWNTFGPKPVTLSVTRNDCTSTDVLQVMVSNLPTFCGDALVIEANFIEKTNVEVDWFYQKPDSVQHNFQVEWAWESNDFEPVTTTLDAEEVDSFLHYTALHTGARRGTNFYRVKLEDSDGTVLYSNIAEVLVTGDFSLVHVYPNPFSENLTVEIIDRIEGLPITLELVSVEGRLLDIYQAPEADFSMQIPTGHLPSGMYFLLVKYGGSPQKIFKLAK